MLHSLSKFIHRLSFKWQFLAAALFFLAVLTRTLWLDLIPTSFSHDEMSYLINAKSVAVSGVGRYGDWSPFSLQPVEASLAELGTTVLAGFFRLPFGPMINGRLLPVLISLSLPFLIASISYSIFKSRRAALFTWALALFNPWIWQNGRMTFDIPISLWFYVVGTALFLHLQGWRKLIALLPFFIGFYSYQGFKLILPGICLILSAYALFEKGVFRPTWQKIWPSLVTSIFAIGLLGYYLVFQFSHQTASQARIGNQIITPQSDNISQAVNTDRRLAFSTPLNPIFLNKYTQTAKEIIGRYLLVFGGRELFFEVSASSSSFAVWNHGLFYLIDALLIALGLAALISRKQYLQLGLLVSLSLVAVLPAVLNQGIWLYFRPSYMFCLLLIFSGIGLEWLWTEHRKLFPIITGVYCLSIINFAFVYFVRYPVYASETIFFSPRLLSEYLHRLPATQKAVVFEKEPEFVFTNLIFYYDLFNHNNASEIQKAYKTQTYEYKNLSFLPCVPENFKPDNSTTYIIDSDVPVCTSQTNPGVQAASLRQLFASGSAQVAPIFLRSVKDSGVNYTIYNQTLCAHSEEFSQFVRPQSLHIFDLSKLPVDEFCQNWMTKDLPVAGTP